MPRLLKLFPCQHVLLAAVLSIVPVASATAQAAARWRVGLETSAPTRPQVVEKLHLPSDIDRTFWKEGGAVTALAAIIAINSLAWREDRDGPVYRVIGSAAVAAIFFWPGALIGSLFPKD